MESNPKIKFTATHRILHAASALLMTLLFLTGFLRMYWMSKKTILNAIESTLLNENQVIEREQLVPIAKEIQAPMWQWHEYAAYVMAIVFLARIIYMLVKGIRFPSPLKGHQPLKDRLQGVVYLLFYMFVAISIVTGFYMKWGDGTYEELAETIHKWAVYWFPAFIFLHFAGILILEFSDKKGISSKMISGE